MVKQDESVVSNMSEGAMLHRSSWKADAIRRGDLKISGPIPITEETPLNDDEEKEYAEKHNIDPAPQQSNSPSQQQAQQPPAQASVNGGSLRTISNRIEGQVGLQEGHHELRHKRSSTAIREISEMQRRSSVEPASYSSPSPFPSLPDSTTKTTPKKKRKSGLRNVFRKMFGRRSREQPQQQDTVHKHGYHRSDPGLLTQSPETPKENGSSGPRISDIPVRELEPINPLGQHLPFPMNVNAPAEASPPHEYLTFERPPDLNRRRATLPSVLLSNAEAQALSAAWSGSGKQGTSWDERHDAESIPSPQIGIALSSPTPPTQSVHSKRRSRSAGALRDLARGRPSTERRRSAEIRYWRNSYQSGSVYSAATPRPHTAQTVGTVQTTDTLGTVSNAPEESIAESRTAAAPTVAQHDQDISQIELPIEAFNFGNLKSEFSDDELQEEEVVDMPVRPEQRLSIEERVKNLEDNMRTLETSVHRLSSRSNRQTIILENAPRGRRSRNRSSSATSDRQFSHHSSKSSNKTLSVKQDLSEPPSPILAPLSAVEEVQTPNERPQTVVALGPLEIPRPATAQLNDPAEQFTAIYATLNHERAARKALEKQVISLQHEVSDLHALVSKFISTSPSYPTPSPDAVTATNEERLSTPRAGRRPERGLGFEIEEEASSKSTQRCRARETMVSRFSQSDCEGDYSATSSRDDITSPDVWATPKEESGFGSGFFAGSKADVTEKGDGEDEMF
ncbi:hypothetical protein K469DRAFT_575439 [Zopfia rhizophila CBS 207.26]|uniref:Uncharacterized protein n=1 Tax=Zopfia rhizophila CBS 207.26 TaxID=1314779 RepID=A0A6A6E695_9PEZI|nr:hypothetical protein K469DRAFT_575439 [Zopfia rhizophila CBS 207.26]